MPEPTSDWKRWIARLAATLFACAYCLLPFLLPPDPATGAGVDSSWMIGLTQAAQQGEISGRDLFSTYGWLFQGLGRLARALHATGSAYDSLAILLLLQNALAVALLGLCLFLIDRVGWRTLVAVPLALLFLGFIQGALHRPFSALVAVLVLWRALRAPSPRRRLAGAALASFLAFLAQLLTFEMGVFALVAGLGALAGVALLGRLRLPAEGVFPPPRELGRMAGVFVGLFAAANLALGVFFAATGPPGTGVFTYLGAMRQMVRGYPYALSYPWALQFLPMLLLLLIGLYAVGFVARHARRLAPADLSLFVFLAAFGAVLFKSATVRADMGHIWLGITPLVIVFLLLGRDWLGDRPITPSPLWPGLALLFCGIWAGIAIERIQLPFEMLRQKIRPWQNLPGLATFEPSRAAPLPPSLAGEAGRGIPLLVFPYQTAWAALAGRPLVAPVIQAYQADTVALERLYVERLEAREKPFQVLYAFDQLSSLTFEGVQQVSRNPAIFEYLLTRFQPVAGQPADPGTLLLEKRPAPRPLAGRRLGFERAARAARRYPDLVLPRPEACSLVRLRLRLRYPFYTALGRGSQVAADFSSGGQPVAHAVLISLDGSGEFATWVSLLPSSRFPALWTAPPGAPLPGTVWDRISFSPTDGSFLAFAPRAVEVAGVDCVNPS